MKKTQLVDALAERLGDRRTAAAAVDGLLETIVDRVRAGDSVSLAGFGVFEGRARAARTARNPRTGDAVDVPATTVPAFRPGTSFRSAVADGAAPPPRATPARRSAGETAVSAEPAVSPEPAEPAVAPTGRKAASDGSFSAPSGKAVGKAGAESGGKAEKAASGKAGKAGKGSQDVKPAKVTDKADKASKAGKADKAGKAAKANKGKKGRTKK